jgi:leader peptidase (prepilin peptidase)/N-methyltransferase
MTVMDLVQHAPMVLTAIAFAFGLLVGSFLNVVIHRLPLMMEREWRQQCSELVSADSADGDRFAAGSPEVGSVPAAASSKEPYNLVVPRSACPVCKTQIHAWQNIPIVSYLILRGRCAACGTGISIRYPIVELLTGVLSAVVVWHFGFAWEAAAALVFTWCLIALAGIDIDHQLLPDSMTLPLLWLGLLISLLAPNAHGLSIPTDPPSSIIGAAAGYLSLWGVFHAFRLLTGKEGMGYGDFKLFAAFGAWFGWQMLLLIILFAAFAGAVIGIALMVLRRHGRDVPIPFGPFLAAAGWVALLWGPQLIERYLHLSGLGDGG